MADIVERPLDEILDAYLPDLESPEEKLVWLLGDMMNAVENYFGAENPKRLGHINSSAIRVLDEVIQPLRSLLSSKDAQIEALTATEHRVCAGCGSSRNLDTLRKAGHWSCCPEREMLTAKEWRDRADLAESRLAKARKALERLGSSEAFDISRMFRRPQDDELIARMDFARDFCASLKGEADNG